MAKGPIPFKSPQGLAELSTRSRGLGQRHRTVLLLADGRRDASQVRGLAAQAGSPAACFDELVDEVEAKIYKPHRSLVASRTITRARRVLDAQGLT